MPRRANLHARLASLEARAPAPASPAERGERVRDFLDTLLRWRQAGCPDTEEGRELQRLSKAFRKQYAERRGEGSS
jgi:hypothetical protein